MNVRNSPESERIHSRTRPAPRTVRFCSSRTPRRGWRHRKSRWHAGHVGNGRRRRWRCVTYGVTCGLPWRPEPGWGWLAARTRCILIGTSSDTAAGGTGSIYCCSGWLRLLLVFYRFVLPRSWPFRSWWWLPSSWRQSGCSKNPFIRFQFMTRDLHAKKLWNESKSVSWWSGVVDSTLASINEVNLRWDRLVLRWATVFGFNSRCRTSISVCNQPATLGQLSLPSIRGR